MNSQNKICSLANVNKRGETTDHIWGQKCKETIKDLRNTLSMQNTNSSRDCLPRTTQGRKVYFQNKC